MSNDAQVALQEAQQLVAQMHDLRVKLEGISGNDEDAQQPVISQIDELAARLRSGGRDVDRGLHGRPFELIPTAEEAAAQAGAVTGDDMMLAFRDHQTVVLAAKWLQNADQVIYSGAAATVARTQDDHGKLQDAVAVLREYETLFEDGYNELRAAYEEEAGKRWLPARGGAER
jgi:hypothetical protein